MPPIGSILGNRYRILQNLARGGMSTIYLCEDIRLVGKKWVLKEFTAQYGDTQETSKALDHFKREASLLANLEHRNLPKVVDYFFENGNYHFVMEFVEGEDLSKIMAKSPGPIPEKVVADWAIQIATVLYFLHCRKPKPIIFRDIKPSNIMITGNTVKLIDFGIARHFTPGKKGDTMRIGSPGYAPPEQYSGQTDPRSDIFSLGVTLLQLLTKFDPTTTQTPFKFPPIRNLNPSVSTQMAKIVEKAVQIDPNQRYQTAIELKKDLQTLIGAERTSPARFTSPSNVPTLPVTPLLQTPQQAQQQAMQQAQQQAQQQAMQQAQGPPGPPPGKPQVKPPPQKGSKQAIAALKKGKKSPAGKIFAILLVLILGAGGVFFYMHSDTIIVTVNDVLKKLGVSGGTEIRYNKEFPEDLFTRKGIMCINKGDFKNAFENLDRVRAGFPDDGEALLYLNNAYALASGSEKITIGLVLPSDGSRANPAARKIFRGVALAQHSLNMKGGVQGKKIHIIPAIFKEGGSRNAIRGLWENPDVLAVIGDLPAADVSRIAPMVSKSPFPVIIAGGQNSPGPPVYSLPQPDISAFTAMARFAKQDLKPLSMACIYEKGAAGIEPFRAAVGPAIRIIDFSYTEKEVNVPDLAQKVAAANPELVLCAVNISGDGGRKILEGILRELSAAKIRLNMLFPEELYYYVTRNNLQNLIAGASWSLLPADPGSRHPEFNQYLREYYLTFGGYPEDQTSAAYFDCLSLIAGALENNKTDRASITEYLNGIYADGTFNGAAQTLLFKSGKASIQWFCVKAEGGRVILKKTLQL